MTNETENLKVSAPGRICLFGEHQDYLGLPVIAAAVGLRISVSGKRRNDKVFILDMPDILEQDRIDLSEPVNYIKERDYFRSGLNVLLRMGIRINHGYNCRIRGNIPINAGTSSSSALTVAWIKFLLNAAKDNRAESPIDLTKLAHEAEVLEFKEPGGMMDHFMAAFGGIRFIDFNRIEDHLEIPAQMGKFILGDSCEPKDTTGMLARVKMGAIDAMKRLKMEEEGLCISNLHMEHLERYSKLISDDQLDLLEGNIVNRELTKDAKKLMMNEVVDNTGLGELLTRHHVQLRDKLRISTPKIDRMLDAAMNSGALGGKINGSGGGGCMFVYAPENTEEIAESIKREGGVPYIISIDDGARVESK